MARQALNAAAAALLLAAASGAGWAAPIATLTFTVPTGTVYFTDSIPVMLTLALDAASDPLATDGTRQVISGLTTADIQANLFTGLGVDESGATPLNTRTDINVAFGCSGNFNTFCTTGPPYDFNFDFTMVGPIDFSLAAGSSVDYLFGTFVPTPGAGTAGTHTFFYSGIFIQVFDPNNFQIPGDPASGFLHIADVPIADTQASGVAFVRDVQGPEPGTYALMLGGLGAMLGFVRRRKA